MRDENDPLVFIVLNNKDNEFLLLTATLPNTCSFSQVHTDRRCSLSASTANKNSPSFWGNISFCNSQKSVNKILKIIKFYKKKYQDDATHWNIIEFIIIRNRITCS